MAQDIGDFVLMLSGAPDRAAKERMIADRDAEIAEEARREEREKVARWMIGHSLVTGHGDTIEDLLTEAWAQIATLRPVRP